MPRQSLKKRADGRFACRYQDKFFYGKTQGEALAARDEYKRALEESHLRELENVQELHRRELKNIKETHETHLKWLLIAIFIISFFFLLLLIYTLGMNVYDFTHTDRGWYQYASDFFQNLQNRIKTFFS